MIDPERYEIDKVMARPDSQVFVTDLIRRMKWRPNEAILDYGCGPGTIANELLLPIVMKTHSHVYGVDNSQEMIEYAQLRYAGQDRQYQQVPMMFGEVERMQQEFMSFQLGDLLGWFPFDSNFVFDKMFCIFVFHVVKNYQKAAFQLSKYLKPGGQLGFTLPSKTIYFKMYQMLLANPKWNLIFEKLPEYIPDWMEKDEDVEKVFRNVFEKAGFKILDSKTVRRDYVFEDLDEAAEFGLSINPLIKKVPVAALPALRREYRDLLLNNADRYNVRSMEDGGPAKIDYEVVVMLLEKPDHGRRDKDEPGLSLREIGVDLTFGRDSPIDRYRPSTPSRGNTRRESPSKGYGRESPTRVYDREPCVQTPRTCGTEYKYGRQSPTRGYEYERESPTRFYGRESPPVAYGRESPTKTYAQGYAIDYPTGRESPVRSYGKGSPVALSTRETTTRTSRTRDGKTAITDTYRRESPTRTYEKTTTRTVVDNERPSTSKGITTVDSFARESGGIGRSESPLRTYAREYDSSRDLSTTNDYGKEAYNQALQDIMDRMKNCIENKAA